MTTLVHAALTARRAARTGYRFAVAAAFALLCWLGAFSVRPDEIGLEHGLALVLWGVVFGQGAQQRMRDMSDASPRLDLELGLLLLVAVHAVIQMAGGLTEALYPLVYVLVAFFASFARKPMGTALVLSAVAIEAPLYFLTEGRADPKPFALHALFIVFFGLLNLVFTRVEIVRVRETGRRELDDEKKKVRDDARLYRLVGAATDSHARDEERVYRSSVEEVRECVLIVLQMQTASPCSHRRHYSARQLCHGSDPWPSA